jgi:polyisoprenoid-binding protein YceI
MHRRSFLCASLAWPLLWPGQAHTAPRTYALDPGSKVTFTFTLAGIASQGTMPVAAADLSLDFAAVERSRVSVTLDATGARTTLPLADSALRGPSILDTARHPTLAFASTAVRRTATGAEVTGQLRVRGLERPVTLDAQFFRQPDRDPGDLRELVIELTGALSRTAFGATGFPDLVGDRVELRILATITRQG